jgi:hypothetical protein
LLSTTPWNRECTLDAGPVKQKDFLYPPDIKQVSQRLFHLWCVCVLAYVNTYSYLILLHNCTRTRQCRYRILIGMQQELHTVLAILLWQSWKNTGGTVLTVICTTVRHICYYFPVSPVGRPILFVFAKMSLVFQRIWHWDVW